MEQILMKITFYFLINVVFDNFNLLYRGLCIYPTHYKPIYAITFTISNYKAKLIFIQMYHINGVEEKFEKSYNKGHNATFEC